MEITTKIDCERPNRLLQKTVNKSARFHDHVKKERETGKLPLRG